MAGKRSTTPLFDLLQERKSRVTESRRPETNGRHAEPEIAPPVESGDESPPAPRPRSEGDSAVRIAGGVVQMPLAFAGVAVAVALAAVLVAWTLGFNRGEARANSEWALRDSALRGGPPILEPDGLGPDSPIRAPGGTREGQRPDDVARSSGAAAPEGAAGEATAGPARILINGQPAQRDPRIAGQSYLQIQSFLRRSHIESAARTLADRGLDSFAVVDPKTLRDKDGPLYVLFAGLGFPPGQTGGQSARRYRDQVLAAGVAWKASGGTNTFDDAFWKPYNQ